MSAWILLRGLTRESRHWADLPGRLRASGLEGEIVTADLPGSGRHAHARAPWTIGATTDFVRRAIRSQGYASPFRVVALSLGAMVAVDWAQRFPGEIEGMVLINTSMGRHCGPMRRLRPGAWPAIVRALRFWRARRRAEAAIHGLTCTRIDSRETDLDQWTAIYASAPPSRTNALRQLLAAARYRGPAAAPRCPVLVIASRADALVHPACSAQLAAAWSAASIEHPWAGHDLPHDDPAWLAGTIAAWAGRVWAVMTVATSRSGA